MKTPAFVVVFEADGSGMERTANILGIAERDLGLHVVFRAEDLVVLANGATPVVGIGQGKGVVLGDVFQRAGSPGGRPQRLAEIAAPPVTMEALLQNYWGGYIALVVDDSRSGVQILRDPSGAYEIYLSRQGGQVFLFNDVGLARSLGVIVGEPDPAAVLHALVFRGLPTVRTGLRDVEEVLSGTAIHLEAGGRITRSCPWTPWCFTDRRRQITDGKTAADRLRTEAQHCVSAWASTAPSILMELSGGLDSSIITACLRDRSNSVCCVTLATPDPGADERAYAARVAESVGASLTAVLLDRNDVRLDPPAVLTVRPSGGFLHQTLEPALIRIAEQTEADSFFSGGGGDNVFCSINTAAPATDAWLTHGPGRLFLRAVADLASLHKCTAWEAGRLALLKAWRRPRSWRRSLDFLNVARAPDEPDPHPWLEAPTDVLPGRREHVILLLGVQTVLTGHRRQTLAPIRYPLLSQPLVELCLQIPSWLWIAGGRNRAVARDAFRDLLPANILQRRTKGDFSGLLGAIYEKHRPAFAPLLLEGWLAEQGLIDRVAIEAYLESTAPVTDLRFHRLLELATVELWAQSWLRRGRSQGG